MCKVCATWRAQRGVTTFQPSERDPPQNQWLHWTSLPNARLSSLWHTKHLSNSFLSRAIVRYLVILFPMKLLPDIRQSRPGLWLQSTHRTHLESHWTPSVHTAACTATSPLLRKVVYCGLISSNPSLGEAWAFTLLPTRPVWAGQGGFQAPRVTAARAEPPPPPRHQVNSQDLQVAQGSEGSIFDAADLVVVQLPAERKGRGWRLGPAQAEPPRSARLGAPPSPRCPRRPRQRRLGHRAAPRAALLAAACQRGTPRHRTLEPGSSQEILIAPFFFFFLKAEGSNFITLGHPIHYELLPSCHWNNFIKLKACKSLEVTGLPSVTSQKAFSSFSGSWSPLSWQY